MTGTLKMPQEQRKRIESDEGLKFLLQKLETDPQSPNARADGLQKQL